MMRRGLYAITLVWSVTISLFAPKAQAHDSASHDLPDHSGLELKDSGPVVELLYWDNKNLGFGHVALSIRNTGDQGDSVYLSFAMGNDYAVDRAKHGKDPVRLVLPVRSDEQLGKFLAWYEESPYSDIYSSSYGADYDLLKHNCAHAILYALRELGYDLSIKRAAPLALRPWQVFHAAQQLIESSREH